MGWSKEVLLLAPARRRRGFTCVGRARGAWRARGGCIPSFFVIDVGNDKNQERNSEKTSEFI